ncbi:MAG: VOC family protein [Acidimicrobiaceae bacterium]|nr:VOC family protein [Acidimicrobiaceae bacterium]
MSEIRLEAGIVTGDIAGLVRFYCEALGFSVERELSFSQGEVYRLVRDAAQLKLFQPNDPREPEPPPAVWHERVGWAYTALHVSDVASEVAQVKAHGGTVLTDVTNHRPGACYALVTDPEGNVLELLQEAPEP